MRKTLIAAALALALAPALGSACEYYDKAMDAKAAQAEQLAAMPAPQASQAPTSSALKQLVPGKAVKPVVDKSKDVAPQAKPVIVSSND